MNQHQLNPQISTELSKFGDSYAIRYPTKNTTHYYNRWEELVLDHFPKEEELCFIGDALPEKIEIPRADATTSLFCLFCGKVYTISQEMEKIPVFCSNKHRFEFIQQGGIENG
jgi:hypothetical protein